MIFQLKCSSRMLIPVRVLLMVPNVPVPTMDTAFESRRFEAGPRAGSPKLGWFQEIECLEPELAVSFLVRLEVLQR